MLKFIVYPTLGLAPIAGLAINTEKTKSLPMPMAATIYLSILMIVLLLERKFHWARDWRESKADFGLDISYLVLNFIVSHSSLAIYYFLLSRFFVNRTFDARHVGMI